jgi:DNA-binding CsgD family transcriptional regulator
VALGGSSRKAGRQHPAELTLSAADSERTPLDHPVDDDALVDILTISIGVLSLVLATVFIMIRLLLEPSLTVPIAEGGLIAALGPLDGIVFFATIIAVLAAAAVLNNLFIVRAAKRLVVHLSLALGLFGVFLCFMGVPSLICLALVAASNALFMLIWGAVLSTLNSRVLVIMLMFTSVFSGIVVLIDTRLGGTEVFVLFALLSLVSWLSARRVSPVFLDRIALVDRRQSIERHVRGKGNSFTLILVGGMFGITVTLVRDIGLASREITLILGACLLAAGLVIAFFYRDLPSRLGDVMKRLLSLVVVVGLLPFPLLDRVGRIACVCFLLVVGIVNLILIIDSILETSRFNQISPFWIIGLESGIFFGAVLAVAICATMLIALNAQGLTIAVFALAGASCILQIRINNQVYPLFNIPAPDVDGPPEAEVVADDKTEPETVGFSSASWRRHVKEIAAEYRLSLRQREIMELLIKGRDLKYITAHFSISRSTAKTHVSNLYHKMNIHSKQELIDLMERLQDGEEPGR